MELAIFGSLFLMVLGVMVNYGLNADVTQRATMKSFREVLWSAGEAIGTNKPKTVSSLVVQDTHIPNPASPFGIGSVIPLSVQTTGFTRNYRMFGRPVTVEELPVTRIDIKDSTCPGSRLSPRGSSPPCTYLLAGFRNETIPASSLERYYQVYGRLSVCDRADTGDAEKDCCNGQGCGDAGCVAGEEVGQVDSNGNVARVCPPEFKLRNVRIIDPCEGEIISKEGCVRQARMIRDSMVCEALCNKGKPPGDNTNCRDVCGEDKTMNFPWYAKDQFPGTSEDPATHGPGGSHKWTFGALELFFLGGQKLGLQQGYVKETTMVNRLDKSESERAISTTASIDWTDRTTRTIQSRRYGGGAHREVKDITAERRRDAGPNPTWSVNW